MRQACSLSGPERWDMDDRRADGEGQAGRQPQPRGPALLQCFHHDLRSDLARSGSRRGARRAGRRSQDQRCSIRRRLLPCPMRDPGTLQHGDRGTSVARLDCSRSAARFGYLLARNVILSPLVSPGHAPQVLAKKAGRVPDIGGVTHAFIENGDHVTARHEVDQRVQATKQCRLSQPARPDQTDHLAAPTLTLTPSSATSLP